MTGLTWLTGVYFVQSDLGDQGEWADLGDGDDWGDLGDRGDRGD